MQHTATPLTAHVFDNSNLRFPPPIAVDCLYGSDTWPPFMAITAVFIGFVFVLYCCLLQGHQPDHSWKMLHVVGKAVETNLLQSHLSHQTAHFIERMSHWLSTSFLFTITFSTFLVWTRRIAMGDAKGMLRVAAANLRLFTLTYLPLLHAVNCRISSIFCLHCSFCQFEHCMYGASFYPSAPF